MYLRFITSRKYKTRSRDSIERTYSVLANVFILHSHKNCEARKNRRGEQLTRDNRKLESIRLYLSRVFPPISNRPSLSRILHSFSTSRQIGFCSFPSDLFASTFGLLPFYCCSEIVKLWIENNRWSSQWENSAKINICLFNILKIYNLIIIIYYACTRFFWFIQNQKERKKLHMQIWKWWNASKAISIPTRWKNKKKNSLNICIWTKVYKNVRTNINISKNIFKCKNV